MAVTKEDINRWFKHHSPNPSQSRRYEIINSAAKQLALAIIICTPPCADQTAAVRKVREARMTANAAIACEENEANDNKGGRSAEDERKRTQIPHA